MSSTGDHAHRQGLDYLIFGGGLHGSGGGGWGIGNKDQAGEAGAQGSDHNHIAFQFWLRAAHIRYLRINDLLRAKDDGGCYIAVGAAGLVDEYDLLCASIERFGDGTLDVGCFARIECHDDLCSSNLIRRSRAIYCAGNPSTALASGPTRVCKRNKLRDYEHHCYWGS